MKPENLTCQIWPWRSRSIAPQTIGTLTKVFCTSGPNLVVLAWMGDELSRGQAQNGVNFDFKVKFYLDGQSQSPPKTIGILNKVFYTYAPNLVIPAWMGDELSRGQTWWRTDWRTDGQTQATTIPGGQNWPRVKIYFELSTSTVHCINIKLVFVKYSLFTITIGIHPSCNLVTNLVE